MTIRSLRVKTLIEGTSGCMRNLCKKVKDVEGGLVIIWCFSLDLLECIIRSTFKNTWSSLEMHLSNVWKYLNHTVWEARSLTEQLTMRAEVWRYRALSRSSSLSLSSHSHCDSWCVRTKFKTGFEGKVSSVYTITLCCEAFRSALVCGQLWLLP